MSEEDKTFMRITNRQIYERIVQMDAKLDAVKVDQTKIKAQIRWHQIIGGFLITGGIAAFAFLFNWLKDLSGGKP